ncbi:glycoside hydrolase family 43 protein [Lacticaseibacillus absianus]|uniref:glycoside hydrolase family 43 protein n=1 Tax=Lacticaseibacillus absianus TaxID=2729623 RepID=UPI0015CA72B3|nr:glycoside hydrolase family 43 protein [Lacticaseibacillus absianus]
MNPIIDGYYADPEIRRYGDDYWLFATTSCARGQQVHFDAFHSRDLRQWVKVSHVLDISDFSWVHRALWAPSQFEWHGRYFVVFACNDIQSDQEQGGLGLAVADRPEGPYHDYLGHPLIGNFINGAQPIDPHVYVENDRVYLYYGGWQHCNLAQFNDDLTGFVPMADGSLFREITPAGYVEAPCMIHKDGTYYFMWSEGVWSAAGYQVVYAKAHALEGPFVAQAVILKGDERVAEAPGHHCVVQDPQSGEWQIIYHRRPVGETDSTKRILCMDRLRFDQDGNILPVVMS